MLVATERCASVSLETLYRCGPRHCCRLASEVFKACTRDATARIAEDKWHDEHGSTRIRLAQARMQNNHPTVVDEGLTYGLDVLPIRRGSTRTHRERVAHCTQAWATTKDREFLRSSGIFVTRPRSRFVQTQMLEGAMLLRRFRPKASLGI